MHSHQSLHHTWGESASSVCRPPNYEGEMSYEERGLLRSYELNELRDRLAKEAAMQPPSQPPSQLPQQPAPAPTRLATPGGGLAMPEGFTQVGNTIRCHYTYVSKSCQKQARLLYSFVTAAELGGKPFSPLRYLVAIACNGFAGQAACKRCKRRQSHTRVVCLSSVAQ